MSLILHLLVRKHWKSTSLTLKPEGKSRKRLQKPPRGGNSDKGLYYCQDVFDIVLAQSCLTLFEDDIDMAPVDVTTVDLAPVNVIAVDVTTVDLAPVGVTPVNVTTVDATLVDVTPVDATPVDVAPAEGGREVFPTHVGFLLKNELSTCSDGSNWSYTSEEIEERVFPKRRAKTPVLFVGQLESNRHSNDKPDLARILAEQYCALLPQRTWTPCTKEVVVESTQKKTLRKIETQQNLRSLVSDCPRLSFYPDSETLVGSEMTSPDSPTPMGDHHKILPAFERYEKGACSEEEEDFPWPWDDGQKKQLMILEKEGFLDNNEDSLSTNSHVDADIGLQICLDLLTNKLAGAAFRHHPAESEFRASGLQIWLMIEAYESVRHHLQQEYSGDYVGPIEAVLSHWLQALYSVYQLSQAKELDMSMPTNVTR